MGFQGILSRPLLEGPSTMLRACVCMCLPMCVQYLCVYVYTCMHVCLCVQLGDLKHVYTGIHARLCMGTQCCTEGTYVQIHTSFMGSPCPSLHLSSAILPTWSLHTSPCFSCAIFLVCCESDSSFSSTSDVPPPLRGLLCDLLSY